MIASGDCPNKAIWQQKNHVRSSVAYVKGLVIQGAVFYLDVRSVGKDGYNLQVAAESAKLGKVWHEQVNMCKHTITTKYLLY